MNVIIPGQGYEDKSLNTDYGSYQMNIQQKNLLEYLPYYAVVQVLQEVTADARLFDLYDDIYCRADKC